jgi:1,2-phenylacetyl-CoA epoxidase PaaB subunit
MFKILKYISICILLIGCAASASSFKKKEPTPHAQIVDQNYDEMLKLAREVDQERKPAIYIVVISSPEIITATPPKK